MGGYYADMPRTARVVIPDCPHHVTQRGNNRAPVFFVDQDYRVYLEMLREGCEKFGLEIVGYCLMPNHVHLVAIPEREDSLAKGVGRTNLRYTQYINRLHGRSGHLWQDRFFSSPLDEEYFWNALIYTERNPVRAKMVREASRYWWSSAAAHCGQGDATGLLDLPKWHNQLSPPGDWAEALARPQDEQVVAQFRRWTNRGCPLGNDSFLSKLERAIGRRLRPLPVGRPRKRKPKRSATQK